MDRPATQLLLGGRALSRYHAMGHVTARTVLYQDESQQAMKTPLLLSILILTGVLAACSGSGQSQAAACKKAVQQELSKATQDSSYRGTEPASCRGLPPHTLEKLIGEVVAQGMILPWLPASPSPSASPSPDGLAAWQQNGGIAQTDKVQHDAALAAASMSKADGRRLAAAAVKAGNNSPPVDFGTYEEVMTWYQGAGNSIAQGKIADAKSELRHANRLMHQVTADMLSRL